MANGSLPPYSDTDLIARCLAGVADAWTTLYARFHRPLRRSLALWLRTGDDDHLVDEIVARVWFALLADGGSRLARFDASRGARLITYLRAMARDELSRHFRSERRRKRRERSAVPGPPTWRPSEHGGVADSLAEFKALLTPRERDFLEGHLLGGEIGAPSEAPPGARRWQTRHRIHRKFLAYLARR